ncbi:hypothetical protein PPACK8108_LOCUS21946 [Phakopsora pachyrhizi]|uniref:Uncharacterized protein n=1 Tax=Phakopsora pachyrhizi TaxID=170000 RepID=A0AAV0BL84_PHAPC|nr:hypothetical protein PPACK8108_LOCUS21946 [Phakopsora pachyrhizi]
MIANGWVKVGIVGNELASYEPVMPCSGRNAFDCCRANLHRDMVESQAAEISSQFTPSKVAHNSPKGSKILRNLLRVNLTDRLLDFERFGWESGLSKV